MFKLEEKTDRLTIVAANLLTNSFSFAFSKFGCLEANLDL